MDDQAAAARAAEKRDFLHLTSTVLRGTGPTLFGRRIDSLDEDELRSPVLWLGIEITRYQGG